MILITGATSGIGEACAWKFAESKRPLYLLARRLEILKDLSKTIRDKHGVSVEVASVDVSKRSSIESWAKESSQLLSKVEVLVNNAGLAKGFGPFQENNPDDWDTMIDTNIKGLLNITKAVIPHFLKRQSGHVVHIGSVAGRWSYGNGNIYCATKSAVAMLTETMRLDLAGKGVRVTNICPGMVETNFSVVRFDSQERANALYKGMTPLSAKDVAEAVFWANAQPPHVNIQEIVLYPTDQASTNLVTRK